MTDRLAYVYADLEGSAHLVGRLYAHNNKGKETASFEYQSDWLTNPLRYALEPALALGKGQYHTPRKLFGSLGDSAPDRWGRTLMKRAETRRAEADKSKVRTLCEMDYLLMVNDETRLGALRFADEPGTPFLADDGAPVPLLINLPKFLSATEALLENGETAAELKLLLAPGSSLGGARPKASVREKDGRLAIAKFPRKMTIMAPSNGNSWRSGWLHYQGSMCRISALSRLRAARFSSSPDLTAGMARASPSCRQ